MKIKEELINALIAEIKIRKDNFPMEKLESIYFGGGTPSVLSSIELCKILDEIYANYKVKEDVEITLEANPDDLSKDYLEGLKAIGVNRLSIGIQSFFDDDLKWMNRSHNAEEAYHCIVNAQDVGFDNLTVDLIFGSPTSSAEKWQENLKQVVDLKIAHLSCYGLTVEPDTALSKMIKLKKSDNVNEQEQAEQFSQTIAFLTANSYEHYEISNYCLEGQEAKHNSNYWLGKKYLGLGPSAHSFDGENRYWNIANNLKYIELISNEKTAFTKEILSDANKYNEYILTRLRTKWGCKEEDIALIGDKYVGHFNSELKTLLKNKDVIFQNQKYLLTEKGKMFADQIASSLFYVTD